ncbi:MAG: hypothetical protein AAB113_10930 [Candidatus Eisenbacteria bacterium]
MRGSAARGAASLLWLWAGLACGPGHAHASGAALAPAGAVRAAISGDSLAAAPGDGGAPADGRPISRVEVEAHGIFDPVPPGRLGPVFRLADRLHVRTRPSTVRHRVLVAAGEPWAEARARESERGLRALDIFDGVRVEGRPSGDSVVVTVWTRDAWTTSPEFALERGGGQLFGSVQFSERNLFGRAQQIGVAYREDPTGISRSIEVADPGVDGSRVRVAAAASGGSSGTINSLAVGMPFYAEDAPLSFGIQAERANTTARLFDTGVEVARFARRLERVEMSVGRGRRFDRTIARLTGSFLVLDRSFGGSTLELGAPVEFAGGEERLRVRRFAAEGRLWRPGFVERTAVDRLDGIEDFDLGRSLALALGFSPRALGGSVDEGYAAVRMDAGADARGAGFGWLRLGLSSRLLAGPREASGRLEARWVNQTIPRHTLVVAALGAAGWRTPRDFQLVVGGLNGLRAHGVHALAGDRLWRCNAESRWLIGRDFQHLLSLGAAAFWDAARTRGPGSGDGPWQHDLGLGLRVGLPRSAFNRIVRFDVAWPLAPSGPGPREAVFSFGSSQAF